MWQESETSRAGAAQLQQKQLRTGVSVPECAPPMGEFESFVQAHHQSIGTLQMELEELTQKLSVFLRPTPSQTNAKDSGAIGAPSAVLQFIGDSTAQIHRLAAQVRELRDRVAV